MLASNATGSAPLAAAGTAAWAVTACSDGEAEAGAPDDSALEAIATTAAEVLGSEGGAIADDVCWTEKILWETTYGYTC